MCSPLLLDLWGYSSTMPHASHNIGNSALRSPAKPARVVCKLSVDTGSGAESAKIIQVAIGLWQSCHICQFSDNNKQLPRQVSCGANFTLAVDDNYNLWSWGCGSHGNLGHGDTETQVLGLLCCAFWNICMAYVTKYGNRQIECASQYSKQFPPWQSCSFPSEPKFIICNILLVTCFHPGTILCRARSFLRRDCHVLTSCRWCRA